MPGMSEEQRADAIMNELSSGVPDGGDAGEGGGEVVDLGHTTTPDASRPAEGQGGTPPAEKKYIFQTPDGRKIEGKIDENGNIQLPDLAAILKDPHDHYLRHFSSVNERQMAAARKKIREEELAGISEKMKSFEERMSSFQMPAQPKADAAKPADGVDWSTVDVNDQLAVAQAHEKQRQFDTRKMMKEMFDEYFAPITEASRAEATDALGAAYDAWKGEDLNEFKSLLRQSGVQVSRDGIAFSRTMTPQMVTKIANGLIEHLNTVKGDQTRVQSAIEKAVATMPTDDEGSLWDDNYHTKLLKAYIAEQINSGRPVETDEDCLLIALEGSKQIMNDDVKRIARQSARLARAIAKAKGGVQKIAAKDKEAPPEKKPEDLTGDERDNERLKRMERDGVIKKG
jgi:hypothetical protein